MISVSHDNYGRVIGYVEWRQVGPSGFEVFQGPYIWLQNLWIHQDYRGKTILKELIEDILLKAPDAKYGYFTREKYGHRMSKSFKRESVERVANVFIV